jgi:peptide/nickel transport system permease protein
VLLGFCVIVVAGPWLAPYSPYHFNAAETLAGPRLAHLFGTDQFGRDLLSRMLAGARSLGIVAGSATLLTVGLGTVWGLVAAYMGGLLDEALMRLVDVVISIPEMLIAIVVLTAFGSGAMNLVFAIAIVFAPFVARVIRSATLAITSQEYVNAARVAGESVPFILFGEILPNITHVLGVEAATRFGLIVLLVASLGFLGLGVQPPTPDWGLIVSESRDYMRVAPWLIGFPAGGIAVLVMAAHAMADRLVRGEARRMAREVV